jgi:hypothetical protein
MCVQGYIGGAWVGLAVVCWQWCAGMQWLWGMAAQLGSARVCAWPVVHAWYGLVSGAVAVSVLRDRQVGTQPVPQPI